MPPPPIEVRPTIHAFNRSYHDEQPGSFIVFKSLSQSLGLVAPIFFDFWVREGKGEHTKRCGGGEDDNQTHLRSPGWAWALKVNADILIYC